MYLKWSITIDDSCRIYIFKNNLYFIYDIANHTILYQNKIRANLHVHVNRFSLPGTAVLKPWASIRMWALLSNKIRILI